MALLRMLRNIDPEIADATIEKLETFSRLLHDWNQIHNLTGAKTLEAIYDNIVDSLYPVSFIETPSSLLDVGTGAGFPGVILGIYYEETETVLCEPLNKRASFLKYAVTALGLKYVTVAKMRVEHLNHKPFGMISSRAVTDTKLLLSLTEQVSDSSTDYLFYKGSHVFGEIEAAQNQLNYAIVSQGKRNYLWIKA